MHQPPRVSSARLRSLRWRWLFPRSCGAALPAGPSPEPVPFPIFRADYAFIWRNWPLVPAETLAKVVNATPAQVRAFAQSMGLARQPRITREQLERSSLTIIRRNWHLLP